MCLHVRRTQPAQLLGGSHITHHPVLCIGRVVGCADRPACIALSALQLLWLARWLLLLLLRMLDA